MLESKLFFSILSDINENTGMTRPAKYNFKDIFPQLSDDKLDHLWRTFCNWNIVRFWKALDSTNRKSLEFFIDDIITKDQRKHKLKRILK